MALIYDADSAKDLIGFKIVGSLVDAEEDSGFFGFVAKKGKKTVNVWVLRDPEGNGEGCLDAEGL